MKAVILAGGLGTRLSEETYLKPKPMVEVGNRPIIWHIMKMYEAHAITDFIVCCGYRGYVLKEYFANYALHNSDVRVDLSVGAVTALRTAAEPWTVTLVDTGDVTMTGGRLKRIQNLLKGETFCMTYGDGLSDVNITRSIDFHKRHAKLATVTAVQPPGRFGALRLDDNDCVESMVEKPAGDGGWVSAGFFVLQPGVLNYIADDSTIWEKDPLEQLSKNDQLMAFKHSGFWQPMDTLRDLQLLNNLWSSGNPPWVVANRSTQTTTTSASS